MYSYQLFIIHFDIYCIHKWFYSFRSMSIVFVEEKTSLMYDNMFLC